MSISKKDPLDSLEFPPTKTLPKKEIKGFFFLMAGNLILLGKKPIFAMILREVAAVKSE